MFSTTQQEPLHMKRFIPVILVAAIAALVFALTSGGTSTAHKAAATPSRRAAESALDLRPTALGKILVDANGRTLYLFEADKANMSNCSGACLSLWPALVSHGTPHAGAGVVASKIGTIAATGGKRQVTYNRRPLYYYAADQKPGDTTGQALNQFGAEWYVLGATGDKVDNG
jgi:predicted lipoprotein with Yx(FWY)xxD motif